MKQHISLLALIGLFLVPYNWVARQSPALSYLFNVVFHSQLAHIVGHSLIFALIGAASLRVIPALRAHPGLYAAMILTIAFGQEYFQMLVKVRPNLGDSARDIVVDTLAAACVWLAICAWPAGRRAEGAPRT